MAIVADKSGTGGFTPDLPQSGYYNIKGVGTPVNGLLVIPTGIGDPMKLTSLQVIYSADATGGNRTAILELLDSTGTVVYSCETGDTCAVSATKTFVFAGGITRGIGSSGYSYATTPDDCWMMRGSSLRIRNASGFSGVGDTITYAAQFISDD